MIHRRRTQPSFGPPRDVTFFASARFGTKRIRFHRPSAVQIKEVRIPGNDPCYRAKLARLVRTMVGCVCYCLDSKSVAHRNLVGGCVWSVGVVGAGGIRTSRSIHSYVQCSSSQALVSSNISNPGIFTWGLFFRGVFNLFRPPPSTRSAWRHYWHQRNPQTHPKPPPKN